MSSLTGTGTLLPSGNVRQLAVVLQPPNVLALSRTEQGQPLALRHERSPPDCTMDQLHRLFGVGCSTLAPPFKGAHHSGRTKHVCLLKTGG